MERPNDYPNNARKWSKNAIAKVGQSLREFGFRQPIVVDSGEVIVIGHLRRAAARAEGISQVPVHVAADLSPAQVRQLRLMDNRSHEEAEWDLDILSAEMLELKDLGVDLNVTGFDPRELDSLVRVVNPAEDEVPPVPEEPVTRVGDLWLMGEHRVLCGDATKATDVARLMGDARAGLMNTDPPYGINYDSAELHEHGVSFAAIEGDHHQDHELQAFLEGDGRTFAEVAAARKGQPVGTA